MVSRDVLLKYGAMLLIAVFIGETIFLGLSYGKGPEAEATPTPGALSFDAALNSTAEILELGLFGVAVCPKESDVDVKLKNLTGVGNALFASPTVVAVQFNDNSSISAAEALVADECRSALFRSAIVDLPVITVNTSNGPLSLNSRQLSGYFQNQGVAGIQAFVSPSLKIGDKARVTVRLSASNNEFTSVTVQQFEDDVLASLNERRPPLVELVPLNSTDLDASGAVPDAAGSNSTPPVLTQGSGENASASATPATTNATVSPTTASAAATSTAKATASASPAPTTASAAATATPSTTPTTAPSVSATPAASPSATSSPSATPATTPSPSATATPSVFP